MNMDIDRSLLNLHREKVNKMLQNKEVDKILPYLEQNLAIIKFDNDLMVIWYLGMMTQKELVTGMKSVFEKESTLQELLDRYHRLKFYLRRIENDILDDENEFFSFLAERSVSEYELMGVINSSVYNKDKVWSYLGV